MDVIGKIVLMPRGTYDSTATYNHLDWVRYNGSAWVCKLDNVTNVTPTEGTTWTVLAEDGSVSGWTSIPNKPFETIGEGLNVNNQDELEVSYEDVLTREDYKLTGAVNLNRTPYISGPYISNNRCVWECDAKGQITNGVANAATSYTCHSYYPGLSNDNYCLPEGTYWLSGCPEGGSASTYYLDCYIYVPDQLVGLATDTGEGTTLTITSEYANKPLTLICHVNTSGAQSMTWKPMITQINYRGCDFVPYAQTNKELTDNKFSYSDNGILGAKNLIPYPYYRTTRVENGVTYTDVGDGTILANRTSTSASDGVFEVINRTNSGYKLPVGSYIVSGCPSGGGDESYSAEVYYTNSSNQGIKIATDMGNGATFTITSSMISQYFSIGIYIRVKSGYSASDVLFKPMLRLATDSDGTYQPYAETNYQLTHNKLSYEDNGILGAKNLLPYPYTHTTKTLNGVTFTDVGDGTILVNTDENGATADATFEISANYTKVPLKEGRYILSGCPSGGGSTIFGYQFVLKNINTSAEAWKADFGDGATFEQTSIVKFGYSRINIKSGTVCNNLVFKPMIRLASDSDDTWQPYALTNRQITDEIIEIKDRSTKMIYRTGVTASADGTVRIPGSGTNSLISTANTYVIKPVCDYKSDGTPYKFTSLTVFDGYAHIILAEDISNVNIGVEVIKC